MNAQIEPAIKQLIQEEIGTCTIIPAAGGATSATLYRLISSEKGVYYLKINHDPDATESLNDDKTIYEWLSGKIEVPKVIFYKKTATYEALCVTEIEGITLEAMIGTVAEEEIIQLYAQTLKKLHSMPIEDCTVQRNLAGKLNTVKYRIEQDLIAADEFEEGYQYLSPKELFERLLRKIPDNYEPVFTHGDYCFDNLLIKQGKLSGLIDIGRGGIADKYQDIALAIRSIRHELGDEYIGLFCKEYGLENLNKEKVFFYTLLDEFF
ncbi:APH(3') family aminoglycoside O-phosphotransferase [Runella sp.]|uniref:APH(3') family aminoglycoside O-phosphotransferase n=1 Tax=Runella sp. TaxID=1960881 RepID=UPI003D10630C